MKTPLEVPSGTVEPHRLQDRSRDHGRVPLYCLYCVNLLVESLLEPYLFDLGES